MTALRATVASLRAGLRFEATSGLGCIQDAFLGALLPAARALGLDLSWYNVTTDGSRPRRDAEAT